MGEIKFRGKRMDNGEWIEGYYVCIGEKYPYIYTGKLEICKGFEGLEKYQIIPETVGQYTGMKDYSGTEIYEGDIVRIFNGDGDMRCHDLGMGEVRFHCGEWCLYTNTNVNLYDTWAVDRVVVEGNIYDDPKLTEEA